jgi:site-specific recombinase XerD
MGGTKPFDAEIAEFLAHKRILGFKYVSEETTLRRFQRFCEQRAFSGSVLTGDLVEAWCRQWPTDPDERKSKIRSSAVRQFALYLTSTGRDAHIPMNQAHNHSRHSRYEAYVFTDDEIARIIDASDRVYPHPNSNVHLVMPVLIRLLYSSGPRISETLGIRLADVNTATGVIKLTATKNGKHRLIPLSAAMAQVVGDYIEMAHPHPAGENFLFKNPSGKPFGHAHIYSKFREVLIAAGIPHGGRGAGPRIHDVRYPNLQVIQTFPCSPW